MPAAWLLSIVESHLAKYSHTIFARRSQLIATGFLRPPAGANMGKRRRAFFFPIRAPLHRSVSICRKLGTAIFSSPFPTSGIGEGSTAQNSGGDCSSQGKGYSVGG